MMLEREAGDFGLILEGDMKQLVLRTSSVVFGLSVIMVFLSILDDYSFLLIGVANGLVWSNIVWLVLLSRGADRLALPKMPIWTEKV